MGKTSGLGRGFFFAVLLNGLVCGEIVLADFRRFQVKIIKA
jgi:hypothetical protein